MIKTLLRENYLFPKGNLCGIFLSFPRNNKSVMLEPYNKSISYIEKVFLHILLLGGLAPPITLSLWGFSQ